MELLYDIFAIIFYILFFCWAFFKIRNVIFIKKKNCKDIYKSIKKDLIKQKLSKYLFRIIIAGIIIFAVYLAVGLIMGGFAFFMSLITFFGFAYIDSGTDSSFYHNLLELTWNYFGLLKYIAFYVYIIVFMTLIRGIYINILGYKQLNSNDMLNNLQQKI